jgi:DNA-directed RNA polymerase specialized sigma24 family protein
MDMMSCADPLEIVLAKERAELLGQAFRSLTTKQQMILALTYCGHCPAVMVGRMMGLQPGNVGSIIWLAKRSMRKYLREHGIDI